MISAIIRWRPCLCLIAAGADRVLDMPQMAASLALLDVASEK